jgi:hypothetical protein
LSDSRRRNIGHGFSSTSKPGTEHSQRTKLEKRIGTRGQSPLMKLMEKSQTAFEERTRPADGIEESMKSEFLSSRE